jgi:formylglycine-generating enzyme required for sulfatase activity
MGASSGTACRSSDETQHTVTLTHSFEIQSTEVTQAQFASVMGYNPSYFGPKGEGADCGADCPVESVTWHEAAAYCNAVSAIKGYASCYADIGSGTACTTSASCSLGQACANGTCIRYTQAPAYSDQQIYSCPGYRLPTEAEWEYAYRAGTTSALYNGPIGPTPDSCLSCTVLDPNAELIAWYCVNSKDTTHPVAHKQANPWKLFDMAGNVNEWCNDVYASSSTRPVDPWGAASGPERVYRGGSFAGTAGYLRASSRGHRSASQQGHKFLGLRCARTL